MRNKFSKFLDLIRSGIVKNNNDKCEIKKAVDEIKLYIDSKLNFNARQQIYFSNNNRIFTHLLEGFRIFLDMRDLHLSLHVLENRSWEDHVKNTLKKHLNFGSVFVDIGANVGITTIYATMFIGQNGKCYCFEAVPETFKILHDNLEINGLLDRVTIENQAVSIKSGSGNFEYFSSHAGMSGIRVMDERLKKFAGTKKVITIPFIVLDEYFSVNTKIDFIKIDVEGFEFNVIRGAERIINDNPNIKILIEFYPENIRSVLGQKELENFLNYIELKRFKIFETPPFPKHTKTKSPQHFQSLI